jgi:hypothetical protein
MPVRVFVLTVGLRSAFLGAAFYLTCLTIDFLVVPGGWSHFFLKVSFATALYVPLGWIILLDADAKESIKRSITRGLSFAPRTRQPDFSDGSVRHGLSGPYDG